VGVIHRLCGGREGYVLWWQPLDTSCVHPTGATHRVGSGPRARPALLRKVSLTAAARDATGMAEPKLWEAVRIGRVRSTPGPWTRTETASGWGRDAVYDRSAGALEEAAELAPGGSPLPSQVPLGASETFTATAKQTCPFEDVEVANRNAKIPFLARNYATSSGSWSRPRPVG
jgi:hypothetical protein